MRKLLFLWPLTAGTIHAAPLNAPRELTAILNVPAGAKTMVLNFDDETHPQAIFTGTKQLVIRLVASPKEVRFAWRQQQGKNTMKSTVRYEEEFSFTATPSMKKTFTPPLNTWTSLWTAEQVTGWTVINLRKQVNLKTVSVKVLFTPERAEKISNKLQPPMKP